MNTSVPASNSASHWHPKITGYRLLVISTTISLGSAKAIATLFGKSYASTTIEWIAGVVVFILLSFACLLSLFVAGWFEDTPSEYPKLAWFFDRDLVRLIWNPQYSSEERQRTDGPHPRITGYRLLVSSSVFLFGMMKASLSYTGLGDAANVPDWILGVVITSILYVIGLYERNPMNMMPYLFETHYDDQFYSGRSFFSDILLHLVKFAFAIGFSLMWSIILEETNIETVHADIKRAGFLTSFIVFHTMLTMFMLKGLMWLFLLAGIGFSLYPLCEILSAFGRLTPFRKLTALLRHVFLWIPKTISRQCGDFNTPTWVMGTIDLAARFYWFIRRFGVHILLSMALTLGCAMIGFYYLGVLFVELFDCEGKDTTIRPHGPIVSILFYAYYIFGLFFFGFGACFCALNFLALVFYPFFLDLEDPFRKKLLLEF